MCLNDLSVDWNLQELTIVKKRKAYLPWKLYFFTNSAISASDPGSCFPNWLQGNAKTFSPSFEY